MSNHIPDWWTPWKNTSSDLDGHGMKPSWILDKGHFYFANKVMHIQGDFQVA